MITHPLRNQGLGSAKIYADVRVGFHSVTNRSAASFGELLPTLIAPLSLITLHLALHAHFENGRANNANWRPHQKNAAEINNDSNYYQQTTEE
jgi:hypothetical protein